MNIKTLREKAGMTQQALADATGIPKSRIAKWETGKGNPKAADSEVLENFFMEKGLFDEELTHSNIVKAPPGRFPKKTLPGRMVHFYDVDFAMGDIAFLDNGNDVVPAYTMDIPVFAGCTAFRGYSESMEPLIKSGAILFGTKVHEWNVHLEYGQIYGIICTDQRRYLKRVRKCKEDPKAFYTLESENPKYDPFEIPKECIKSVWLIHGWLNQKV